MSINFEIDKRLNGLKSDMGIMHFNKVNSSMYDNWDFKTEKQFNDMFLSDNSRGILSAGH